MKFFLLLFSLSSFSVILDCSHNGFSYKEKISQMMVVTYKKDPKFAEYLAKEKLGGVIGFSYDLSKYKSVNELKNDLKKLQDKNNNSLFLTIDHEGGLVQRLKKYKELTYIPSAKVVGKYLETLTPEVAESKAYELGRLMGSELRSIGFNWNFAPSLDVDHMIKENVISKYNRAFSDNPKFLGKYGSLIIRGMEKYLLSTAKHFPGQGISTIDAHNGICYDAKTCPKFKKQDFIPFKEAINSGVSTVMIGHVYYANMDNKLATFSHKIVSGYLKQKFNFNGIVVSDDFTMGALGEVLGIKSLNYRLGNFPGIIGLAAEKAIKAGIHVLVMSEFGKGRRELQVRDYLCKKISTDKELRERIDQSFQMISNYKEKIKLNNQTEYKYGKAFIRNMVSHLIKKYSKSQVKSWDKNIFKYYYF